MEILSINFAIFVVQLAFCIIPFVVGIRLFCLTSERKDEIGQKLSKKILGDPSLMTRGFFNLSLYFIACIFLLSGTVFSLFLFL